jgi:hypothetical protein
MDPVRERMQCCKRRHILYSYCEETVNLWNKGEFVAMNLAFIKTFSPKKLILAPDWLSCSLARGLKNPTNARFRSPNESSSHNLRVV